MDARRVLGLDLAARTVGWAVLAGPPEAPHLVACGAFTLPGRRPGEPRAAWQARRYRALAERVRALWEAWGWPMIAYEYTDRPRHAAWRGGRPVTAGSEFNAAWGLGLAEGLLAGVADALGIDLVAVSVEDAKRSACGNAYADKETVRTWLAERFGWSFSDQPCDASDAAAVALVALLAYWEGGRNGP